MSGHGRANRLKMQPDQRKEIPSSLSSCPLWLLLPTASDLRHFHRDARRLYSFPMSTAPGKSKYRCMQCEMTEDRCQCERYCCLCQAQMTIRLCQDGLYYCEPCRDACDYKVAD